MKKIAFLFSLFLLYSCAAQVHVTVGQPVDVPKGESAFAEDTLTICSFNIQFLGHFKSRDNQGLAHVLSGFDIVVVQELVAPPVDGTYPNGDSFKADDESYAFVEEMRKVGFSYWLSEEDTGPTKNHVNSSASEWFITFYKNSNVQPDSSRYVGFVDQTLVANDVYQRVPFVFPFKTTNETTFSLVSVHLTPGESGAEKAKRAGELDAILSWPYTTSEENRDFFVLGDCNIYDNEEFKRFANDTIYSLNHACLNTVSKVYEDELKGKPYDHVFYYPSSNEDVLDNSFEVIDLLGELKLIYPNDPAFLNFDYQEFKQKYSDHLPVVFKVITGKDTD